MKPLILALILTLSIATYSNAETRAKVSTSKERVALEVIVYNNYRGQVKDTRVVGLARGGGEISFVDVAAHIIPPSVNVTSLEGRGGFKILEQSFAYDLSEQKTLMDRYIGHEVKLIEWNEYQDIRVETKATLLSNEYGPIYRIKGEIHLAHPGRVVLPESVALTLKPTLTWTYGKGGRMKETLLTSYLTSGLNWVADYTLAVSSDEKKGSISAWASVSNYSGATYNDAELTLVAGDVAVTEGSLYEMQFSDVVRKRAYAPEPGVSAGPLFEYHAYEIKGETTLKDKESKQLSLLSADGIGIKKAYTVRNTADRYQPLRSGAKRDEKVEISFKIKNTTKNGLGMALPAGTMRIYKEEGDSSSFIGEEMIGHTPVGDTLEIKAGSAFDIQAKRTYKDFKKLSSWLTESTWEVTIENRKEEEVTVSVLESVFDINKSFRVLESSEKYTLPDASTIKFDVTIPKGSKKTITYKIEQDSR